ncbi:phage tail protein [Escherichia coli]|nr:phage tail protein [Escherichia coli]
MEAITGAKGGSQKQHTPVEQPDSAQSMARCRMLLALGEGEFAGGLDATRIFLDGTPLGNPDGTMNFENVSWDFRPGTQTQTPIPGFPAVENETTVGVSLTKATPWTRALSNTQIDAVLVRIGIPGLQQQENDGDIVGTTVQYHIDLAVDGGAYSTVMTKTVTEKLSSLYELTHRINLPKASTGWQIRVVRDTDDSTSQMLQNKTQVQAITEVIDARLRYPHTALLYVSFNAKSFNNIPKISCMPKGRIIRIPSNYDPIARTYSGTWDGTFKWGWTNNPAWIWFDVLTEPRFGLGRRVTPEMLDKWELYRIAQRCDQKVPDGKGGSGTEPRFMFDVYIQSQADAWQVIKDIAAGFNGMTFWGNNMFNVVSDMPADTTKLQILTRASVVGKPVYSSGSEKNRFSSALINFSDPDNHYQDRTTAVMFPELVRQFKFKQTQITAIGCTRESEAQRRGGWAVYSNSLDRIITLQTGLDGFVFVPGTVFAFADERLSGRVYGGRITGYNAGLKAVTIDRGTSAVAGDTLMIRTQGGTVESRVIQAVNGTQLILSTPFTAAPLPNAVFVIDAGQLRLQYFRVTNLKFDDEENTFTITGAEYNASKYDAVDIADVNGNLSAMYNIKVGVSSNGQYYAAGMGIGVQNTPSGMQSQVIFLADRFAVTTMVGGTVTLPFVIQNGQAIIRDTVIGDGTISNAKIGNYIQSNNYVAGSVGWKLDKSGTFENYGSTAGEGAMKQTNQTISVKDGNNVLRVQVGRLTGVF